MNKPIIYLDVDGTILRHPENESKEWWLVHPKGGPANQVLQFLEWATSKCEVRWLTAWCPSGSMKDASNLANFLNVPEHLLQKIYNPYSWVRYKTEAINIHESRKWVWIEDEILDAEKKYLQQHNMMDRFILCNASADPDALVKAWQRAKTLLESDIVDYNA